MRTCYTHVLSVEVQFACVVFPRQVSLHVRLQLQRTERRVKSEHTTQCAT